MTHSSTHVLGVYSSAAAQNYHDVGVTLRIVLFLNKIEFEYNGE